MLEYEHWCLLFIWVLGFEICTKQTFEAAIIFALNIASGQGFWSNHLVISETIGH